jgi:hypothetical protein
VLPYIFEGELGCLWSTIGSYGVVKELDMTTVKLNFIDKTNFTQVALFMSVVRNQVANSKRGYGDFLFFLWHKQIQPSLRGEFCTILINFLGIAKRVTMVKPAPILRSIAYSQC